jgi:large subunit ribosomal protein L28
MASCDICKRGTSFGNSRSHALNATPRTWKINVRKIRIMENGAVRRANVCTKCMKENKVTRAV